MCFTLGVNDSTLVMFSFLRYSVIRSIVFMRSLILTSEFLFTMIEPELMRLSFIGLECM